MKISDYQHRISVLFGQFLSMLALLLFASLSANAQCIVHQTAKLLPVDGAEGDRFGSSVAISGNTAIVGAQYDDDNGNFSGSAYLFDVTSGQQLAKLLPADGGGRFGKDYFGGSVAISGTTALVGARGDNEDHQINTGSAYLFDVTTGQQLAKLLASDGGENNYFGVSVAISGTTAIVGAYLDDDNGDGSGSAYLFDVTTGQQLAKLLPNDGAAGDEFGGYVAISGNTAIVGARRDDDNGEDSGSAYLFDVATGQQLAKLLPNDGAEGDRFGKVAISGNTAIVGASGDDASGSAYLFDTTTGQQLAKLLPEDGAAADDSFGRSVGISGSIAIVSANPDTGYGGSIGSAYLFDITTGQQVAKLLPDDGELGDIFGNGVAISGSIAIVGALFDDDNGINSGSAYVFILPSERITVTANSSPPRLITTEAGGQDSFNVVLNTAPTADVTIGITSSNPSEGMPDVSSLTFTQANWNIPQTVTVTGVDDQDFDGDVLYIIVTVAATSADSYYDGQDACDIAVINQDNELTSYYSEGINNNVPIPEKGMVTSWIEVTNDFLISDVNVTLNILHERAEDLDVYLLAPDGTAVELFTDVVGNGPGFIGTTLDDEAFRSITVFSGAPFWSYRPEGNLSDFDFFVSPLGFWTLQVTDDRTKKTGEILDWSLEFRGLAIEPTPGISVSPTSGLITSESGGTDSFDVVLDTEPSDDVTIGVSSSDLTEGTVNVSSLTFTLANWHIPQTVTITGVDDPDLDGDVAYSIVTAAATSTDPDYDGLDADDVGVTNQDDEGPQTYSSEDTPLAIPDNDPNGISSNISVPDVLQIANLTVTLDITHPRPSDLDVYLYGPDPNDPPVQLFNFSGDNNVPDFNGNWPADTAWTLEVYDTKKKKEGTLNSWSIAVDY